MKKIGLMEAVAFAGLVTLGASQSADAYVIDTTRSTPTWNGSDQITATCVKVGNTYYTGVWKVNQTNWGMDLVTGYEQPSCSG